jgi:hypothetical protein
MARRIFAGVAIAVFSFLAVVGTATPSQGANTLCVTGGTHLAYGGGQYNHFYVHIVGSHFISDIEFIYSDATGVDQYQTGSGRQNVTAGDTYGTVDFIRQTSGNKTGAIWVTYTC